MDAERKELAGSIGLLLLRIGIGGFMITHGSGKVQMLIGGEAAKFGDPIGLGSTLSLVLVAGSEFLCALLIVVGLATRLAAIPVVISMAVAAFVVHAADPWTMETAARAFFSGASKTWFSKEPAILYLVPFLTLAFTGGGRFSIDALIAARINRGQAKPQLEFEQPRKRSAA